jgi:hypothetical protein
MHPLNIRNNIINLMIHYTDIKRTDVGYNVGITLGMITEIQILWS